MQVQYQTARRLKKWFSDLLKICLVTVVLIGAIEVVGRVYIWGRYGQQGKTYGMWEPDSELGAIPRRNSYNTLTTLNNYGFRNAEDVFEPKPSGALRVVCLGGSTTFGYNLRDSETYPQRLQERLRQLEGQSQSQVLNAGAIGYSIGHVAKWAERIVPALKPDVVIIYSGVNEVLNEWALRQDGVNLDDLGGTYGHVGMSLDQNQWLKQNSILVRMVDYLVKHKVLYRMFMSKNSAAPFEDQTPEPQSSVHPWVIENYENMLSNLIDYLRDQGSFVVVVRYPTHDEPLAGSFADLAQEIAIRKGVVVSDVAKRFDRDFVNKDDLFIGTKVHVTAQGADLVAEEIFDTINQNYPRFEAQERSGIPHQLFSLSVDKLQPWIEPLSPS